MTGRSCRAHSHVPGYIRLLGSDVGLCCLTNHGLGTDVDAYEIAVTKRSLTAPLRDGGAGAPLKYKYCGCAGLLPGRMRPLSKRVASCAPQYAI